MVSPGLNSVLSKWCNMSSHVRSGAAGRCCYMVLVSTPYKHASLLHQQSMFLHSVAAAAVDKRYHQKQHVLLLQQQCHFQQQHSHPDDRRKNAGKGSKDPNKHADDGSSKSLIDAPDSEYHALSTAEKVKENTKTTLNVLVIVIGGVGLLGGIGLALGSELFSSESANGIYNQAVKDCLANTEIRDVLGEPIKSYGETTNRGRRRHTANVEYEHEGYQYMRMQFYLQGIRRKGTVHLEKRRPADKSSRYEYRYLFLELSGYPSRTIIVHDNRYTMSFNK